MTDDITTKLSNMKRQIDEAEKQVNNYQGRLDGLYERLKTEFGIETLEQAEAELKRMDGELATKEAQLAADVERLEKSYEWGC